MSSQLWGGALAPATPPTEAAASCRGLCRTCYCFSREHWRARADLNRSSKPASKVVAAALPPVKHKLRESRKYVRRYVAAQKARRLPSAISTRLTPTSSLLVLRRRVC